MSDKEDGGEKLEENNTTQTRTKSVPPSQLMKYEELIDEDLFDNPECDNDKYRNILRKVYARNDREKKQLEARNDDMKKELRNEHDKVIELELDKAFHARLTSVVFARWVLEFFTKKILFLVDPGLETDLTTSRIQAAWRTFFDGKCENEAVLKAYGKISVLIPGYHSIKLRVQEKIGRKLTRHKKRTVDEEIHDWIGKRSSELYHKFSLFMHNLLLLNWFVDFETIETLFAHLPDNNKQEDRDLITILHILIKDLMPDNIVME